MGGFKDILSGHGLLGTRLLLLKIVTVVLHSRTDGLYRVTIVFVSHDRALFTVCGAPVGREKVSAQVILLRVGLATLRLSLYTYVCTAYGQERVVLLYRR